MIVICHFSVAGFFVLPGFLNAMHSNGKHDKQHDKQNNIDLCFFSEGCPIYF